MRAAGRCKVQDEYTSSSEGLQRADLEASKLSCARLDCLVWLAQLVFEAVGALLYGRYARLHNAQNV